jgi:hypothetical protein
MGLAKLTSKFFSPRHTCAGLSKCQLRSSGDAEDVKGKKKGAAGAGAKDADPKGKKGCIIL